MSHSLCFFGDIAEVKNIYSLFIQVHKQFEATLYQFINKLKKKTFVDFLFWKKQQQQKPCINHEGPKKPNSAL